MMTPHKKTIPRKILIAFLLTCAQTAFLRCEAFQNLDCNKNRKLSTFRHKTACNVLAEPPRDLSAYGSQGQPRNSKRPIRTNPKIHRNRKDDVWSSGRWDRATLVESRLQDALAALQESIKIHEGPGTNLDQYPLQFPGIRECNSALASFGDGGDLLRALRLYFKMRKTASLSESFPARNWQPVPTPTLVTFSTMMSRAVHAGKPLLAIRLWNIMRHQPDFFSSESSVPNSSRIVPDVKAANILMNAYSKFGDIEMAQDLFDQMIAGGGEDVPKMKPNIVTYNTLLDACHKSGELDTALHVKEQLDYTDIRPDARTYTTLIATVARKATAASGANDPTMAFLFLQEMKSLNIKPNGMTYSALIDVCGRCRRSDLALKGLRLMLDEKAQERKRLAIQFQREYTLSSEVGAWTAAIDACGKAGRIDTAVKLFYSMPNFGVYPNTITCGSMVNCLLRNGRTAESLDVLRYMKKNRIVPSEVMYTALMTSATRLAEFENKKPSEGPVGNIPEEENPSMADDSGATKAVEVYTELMTSLSQVPQRKTGKGKSKVDPNELFRVSLVFQEMKNAGVEPDLACYNAMLKACAKSGDVDRAMEVLDQIRASEDMEPNEITWNSIMTAAGKAGRSDVALATWQNAVKDLRRSSRRRNLSDRSLGALISALIQNAEDVNMDRLTEVRLYQLVVKIWESIASKSEFLGMDLVNKERILENTRIMSAFLHAVVSLENFVVIDSEDMKIDKDRLRQLAISIVQLDCFSKGLSSLRKNAAIATAYQVACSWVK